jgi:hypothetical protein
MSDEDFLAKWEKRCGDVILNGCIMAHCWLGHSARYMTKNAGAWSVTVRVEDLYRLIDMAKTERKEK